MNSRKTRLFAVLATLMMTFTLVSVDYADARRGGSFGSRGSRTFQQAPETRTAPNPTAPVQRSMTPDQPSAAARQQTGVAQQRPGLFNGFGGSMLRGVLIGGAIGMLLGYGFGGMAGMFGFLLQLLLVGLLVTLALRFWRSRQTPAVAGAGAAAPNFGNRSTSDMFGGAMNRDAQGDRTGADSLRGNSQAGSFSIPGFGGKAQPQSRDIDLTQDDLDAFERMLGEVQTAFAEEDHAALRRLTTPEMVSFLSEELADNAKSGVRNDVTGIRLLQADIAEAWNEDGRDYATAALLYEAVDVMRDRATGDIVDGDETPTETTELWTFVRPQGGPWKLSAIQETASA